MQPVDIVRQSLLDQLAPLDAEATELETKLAELATDRWKLKAALKALDATSKPKGKAAAKAAKPSPKQQDVREVAVALVAENPGIVKADLEELIKHKLTTELGFDLKGFEMRWKEVLGSGTFTVQSGGAVTLAGERSDAATGNRNEKDVA